MDITEYLLPILLFAALGVFRNLGAKAKRQQAELDQMAELPDVDEEVRSASSPREPREREVPVVDAPRPAPAGGTSPRPGGAASRFLETLRQLESNMQQAAEEGRPGSLVRHAEKPPQPPPFIKPQRAAPTVPGATAARPNRTERRPRREVSVEPPRRERVQRHPLARLEKLSLSQRSIVLADLLGTPPGLRDD